MFYYLANKRPIDVGGAIDGMLDENQTRRYFLDTTTGEVGCITAGNDEDDQRESDQKIESIMRERIRYRELPRIVSEVQRVWFEEFIREFLMTEDPLLATRIADELRIHGFPSALTLLCSFDDYWTVGWDSWAGDHAFEDLGLWLMKEIHGVTYELKGCEDCTICRAEANGAGLHELLDAFEEQRQTDENNSLKK